MSEQRVVVMGLGNLLWADEGFGVRVAERLYAHYHWPEDVEIVDGDAPRTELAGVCRKRQSSVDSRCH